MCTVRAGSKSGIAIFSRSSSGPGGFANHLAVALEPQTREVGVVGAGVDAVGELDDQLLALADADHVGVLDAPLGLERRARSRPR